MLLLLVVWYMHTWGACVCNCGCMHALGVCRTLSDDSPLGLRRILSQSTDSLNFRSRTMSMESLNDEGTHTHASNWVIPIYTLYLNIILQYIKFFSCSYPNIWSLSSKTTPSSFYRGNILRLSAGGAGDRGAGLWGGLLEHGGRLRLPTDSPQRYHQEAGCHLRWEKEKVVKRED